MARWLEKRNWKTASKQPVKNKDLWQRLDAAAARHNIDWRWVKGHAGNKYNELVDDLAREAASGSGLLVDEGYQANA